MRTRVFGLILAICLVFLLAGLFYIQIVRHSRYKILSEENRLKIVPFMAPRGSIYDRSENALVKDILSFNVSVIYSQVKDAGALADVLSSVLGEEKKRIKAKIEKSKKRPYTPVLIASDIGLEKAMHLEEVDMEYPGLLLDVSARREYIYGETASNVLGYLGFINRAEFEKLKPYGYRVNDLVGRDGVERVYDNYLRGKHGGKQVEVDHLGREMVTMGYKEPVHGKDVYLTIDLALQEYCEDLLKKKRGAIIVMDPDTGAVLAMASSPSYDPGIFIQRERRSEAAKVLKDEQYPLLNRAIGGAYPPGSVFKLIVATCALEEGKATPATAFNCNGVFRLGKATFHCWREGGHGTQTLKEAIKNSCNVYFYKLGLLAGVDDIAEYAAKFGFGERTGIDLSGEKKGLLPTENWKKKHFKERWYKGETVNYAIGQGYLLVTPIQIARMTSVFANGGFLVRPYLVSRIGGVPTGRVEKTDLGISGKTLEVVREGMRMVVNGRRGTGVKARLKNVVVAGKTGTAQNPAGKSHGWFTGFAPFEDPKLTVVVFDEYGGKGGYYAAGTAAKVFRKAEELGLL